MKCIDDLAVLAGLISVLNAQNIRFIKSKKNAVLIQAKHLGKAVLLLASFSGVKRKCVPIRK